MICLQPEAAKAIRSFLKEKGLKDQTLRIDLRSSGCCDPCLILAAGSAERSDLAAREHGITLVIRPELHRQVGRVTVSYVSKPDRKGFMLTAEHPVSEWEGFGVSQIEFQEESCR